MNDVKQLNILMCCHLPLKATLGGAKVYLEAAEFYKRLGHKVHLVGIDEMAGIDDPYMDELWRIENFPEILKKYILTNHSNYDVIEFESLYLPYCLKKEVKSLLVARSVLLDLHFREISIPRFPGLRSIAGLLIKGRSRIKRLKKKIDQSLATMANADFINVPNPDDKKILIKNGMAEEKIIVQPYGLQSERYELFSKHNDCTKKKQKVAFIGTFDNRKGAVEFPEIIFTLSKKHPDIEFKFLGVVGMFPNAEKIQEYLGGASASRVQIIETYDPSELPVHLADCSYGIFPSYLESFGFGVLEMMAMDLPVAAYDCPGVNMMVPTELLSQSGDFRGLILTLDHLIADQKFRKNMIEKGRESVKKFIYENQENVAIQAYLNAREKGR